jgi:hypothetical protein
MLVVLAEAKFDALQMEMPCRWTRSAPWRGR